MGTDSEAPTEAEADTAVSPLAIMVTPGPAADVVPGPTRLAVVSVAESMLTVDEEAVVAASFKPGGTSPPAEMVMAEATVCMVLPVGAEAMELMEPSMNGGACDAAMGNDPAGHKHAQLQACCCAICSALATVPLELPLPVPAMTVTPVPGAVVVFVAMRASGVRVPELMDAAELVFASALAVAFPPPTPAMTVTPPPGAVFPPAVAFAAEAEEPDPEPATTVTAAAAPPLLVVAAAVALEPLPLPATTVTAAAAPPLVELVEPCAAAEAEVELEPLPSPATTVTAAAAPPLVELIEPSAAAAAEVELDPLPAPASTVTAAPAAVVVAEAMSASVVNLAESMEAALEDVIIDAAASAAEPGAPPAEIVTGIGTPAAAFCVEFAKGAELFDRVLVSSAVISLMLLMAKGPLIELVVAASLVVVSIPPADSVVVPVADICLGVSDAIGTTESNIPWRFCLQQPKTRGPFRAPA